MKSKLISNLLSLSDSALIVRPNGIPLRKGAKSTTCDFASFLPAKHVEFSSIAGATAEAVVPSRGYGPRQPDARSAGAGLYRHFAGIALHDVGPNPAGQGLGTPPELCGGIALITTTQEGNLRGRQKYQLSSTTGIQASETYRDKYVVFSTPLLFLAPHKPKREVSEKKRNNEDKSPLAGVYEVVIPPFEEDTLLPSFPKSINEPGSLCAFCSRRCSDFWKEQLLGRR